MFWLTILTMVTDKLTRMAKTLAKPKKESRANVCRLPHPGGFLSKSVWADSKIKTLEVFSIHLKCIYLAFAEQLE